MNSDPNSESEQYTELRLGWVHRVHTLNPGCPRTAPRPRARRNVVARVRLCRGTLPGCVAGAPCLVTAHSSALARRIATLLPLPPVTIQNCIATQSMPRGQCEPCRALPGRIVAPAWPCRSIVLRHAQRPGLSSVTIQNFVSRHSLPEARLSCARRLPCTQACRIVGPLGCIVAELWSFHGALLAVSWPLLRALCACTFFFHTSFFFSFQLLENQ